MSTGSASPGSGWTAENRQNILDAIEALEAIEPRGVPGLSSAELAEMAGKLKRAAEPMPRDDQEARSR